MVVTSVASGWGSGMAAGASPAGVITGLCTRIRRPEGKCGACQKKEQDNPCLSIADRVSVLHAVTSPANDFFPVHRLPPFNEFTLISSFNEPPNEEKPWIEILRFPDHGIPFLQEWISIR